MRGSGCDFVGSPGSTTGGYAYAPVGGKSASFLAGPEPRIPTPTLRSTCREVSEVTIRLRLCFTSSIAGCMPEDTSTRKYRSSGVGLRGRSSVKSSTALLPTGSRTERTAGLTVPGSGGAIVRSPAASGG